MEKQIEQIIDVLYAEMSCCQHRFPPKAGVIDVLFQLECMTSKYNEVGFSSVEKERFYELNYKMNSYIITMANAFTQQYDICWDDEECSGSRDDFWDEIMEIANDPNKLLPLLGIISEIYTLHKKVRQEDGALISSSLQLNDIFDEYVGCNATIVDFIRKIELSDTLASELIPLDPKNAIIPLQSGGSTPVFTSDASLSLVEQEVLKSPPESSGSKQFLPQHSARMVQLHDEHPKFEHAEIAQILNAEFNTQFSAKNCQEHWQRVCKPELEKGRWSQEDDRLLATLAEELQNDYKAIAKVMKNRSVAEIRNRAKILVRNAMKEKGVEQ